MPCSSGSWADGQRGGRARPVAQIEGVGHGVAPSSIDATWPSSTYWPAVEARDALEGGREAVLMTSVYCHHAGQRGQPPRVHADAATSPLHGRISSHR